MVILLVPLDDDIYRDQEGHPMVSLVLCQLRLRLSILCASLSTSGVCR